MIKKSVCRQLGWSEPSINTYWFDGLGLECRKVKEYATTWKAMDIIYNHPFPQKRTFRGLVDEFYWNSMNCQALRNRFRLIKVELRSAINQVDLSDGEIRIISLACGSAEATLETIAEYKKKGKQIRAILVDIDQEALDRAEKLARDFGIEDRIETYNDSAHHISEIARSFNPHIIGMFGLFDYLSHEEAISLSRKILGSLAPHGIFLTCNISPNVEQHFLKWVINWPMVYRTSDNLADLALTSGFHEFRLIYEPLKIHGLLIARKSA
jgi:ubiquinone/menaquinone biosynthesis C-methylase UbiE